MDTIAQIVFMLVGFLYWSKPIIEDLKKTLLARRKRIEYLKTTGSKNALLRKIKGLLAEGGPLKEGRPTVNASRAILVNIEEDYVSFTTIGSKPYKREHFFMNMGRYIDEDSNMDSDSFVCMESESKLAELIYYITKYNENKR